MKAKVSILRNKGRKRDRPNVIEGYVNVSREIASVLDEGGIHLTRSLCFCELKEMGATGFTLVGVEDRLQDGCQYEYQEWFVRPSADIALQKQTDRTAEYDATKRLIDWEE